MKVKVLKEFVDKYSQQLHKVGDTFEADENRIAEINQVSDKLIQVIGSKKVTTANDAVVAPAEAPVVEAVAEDAPVEEVLKKVGGRHGRK